MSPADAVYIRGRLDQIVSEQSEQKAALARVEVRLSVIEKPAPAPATEPSWASRHPVLMALVGAIIATLVGVVVPPLYRSASAIVIADHQAPPQPPPAAPAGSPATKQALATTSAGP